ncbi:hypothetical protein Hanom_Chr15g01382291 [Helianthus anomalus]
MRGFQDDGTRAQILTDAMGVIQWPDDLEFAQAAAYRATEMSRKQGYSRYLSHLTTNPMDLTSYPRPQRLSGRRQRQQGGSNVDATGNSNWGMNMEQGGPSFVNQNQNDDQWGMLGLDNMADISNFGVNQNYNVDHPYSWANNRISDLIGGDVITVDIDNQIYFTKVQHQSNNELVGTQKNQLVYTTPASQLLPFFSR